VKIWIRQSGGFAGLDVCLGSVDLARLPDPLARRLQSDLETYRRSSRVQRDPSVAADTSWYHVYVEDHGECDEITLPAGSSSDSSGLVALVHALIPHLRPPG
jgi:hypothetical protein